MAAVKKKKEEAPKGGFGKFVFGLLFVVIVVGGSFILWQNYQLKANASENVAEDMGEQGSDTLSEGDIVDLIAKVSKHIIVPSDEEPTIATIVDAEKLSQDQAFYSNVKDGDKVLIYMNAQKALIYRESEDLLVNVGPVYTNESEEEVLPEEEIIEEPAIEQSEEPMTIEIRNGSKTAGVAGDLKDKLLDPVSSIQKKIQSKLKIAKEYFDKPRQIYCNLMVIDNFYNNAIDTRRYILTQEFKVRGNYPGQRTTSRANQHLKEMIEGYIQHFAGKITQWPMPEDGKNSDEMYNGAFQYTTSRDRTWIHNDGWNNWAGVLYMTPGAPLNSGTGIFRFKDGTRTVDEAEAKGNKKILDAYSQDYTQWELVDKIGNVFNRLVLFNSKQYHASLDYFGTNKENGRLFQVFFFSTEK
jgi:hypothetical protein